MRTVTEERGDLAAPPGTRPWAVAVKREIQAALKDALSTSEHLAVMSRAMEQHQGYKQLEDDQDQPFRSYEAFCLCRYPYGLGYRKDDIDRIVRERKSAEAQATAPKKLLDNRGPATREEKEAIPDDIRNKTGYGTDADYLTARIARDRPDILAEMKEGQHKSVRAAARKAGIVKERITILREPRAAATQIRKHFTGEAIAELVRLLGEPPG